MSDDCSHGHNSASEESYFYKETLRLIGNLRVRLASPIFPINDHPVQINSPRTFPALAA